MSISERLAPLARAAAARGTRALLVVEIPAPATCAGSVPSDVRAATMDSTRSAEPATADRADRLAARLGTENARLVHDARERFDPGLLAAEAGTVPAGGALVLLVPPLEQWAAGSTTPRFVARFVRHLLVHLADESAISARVRLEPDAPGLDVPDRRPPELERPATEEPPEASSATVIAATPSAVTSAALAAQDDLLAHLIGRLRDDPRALVVVEAPRGHGKSALLGRLAARLEADDVAYRVCAARRSSLDVLARHRDAALGTGAALPFVAPDAALARGGDLLLVDEAASLSQPVIERLLGRWSRIVLATTSAGYESAGRAFALTLPALLERQRPGWSTLRPGHPMRWRRGDPLDALIARSVMPTTAAGGHAARALPPGWHVAPAAEVDRDALASDESRLVALFGLLVATHYQSTPLDLAHLLDGGNIRLWSIEHEGRVLGVALVAIESGVPASLHEDVLARRRRLVHDLLPQLLAQCANRADALAANLARVVRIAVHPEARRHGLASRLVRRIADDVDADVEGLGASFGETPASVALWAANGYRTFHRGFRRNPRSGQRSIAVLQAMSARVDDVLCVARAIHLDNVEPSGTTEATRDALPDIATPSHDVALLARFARGERNLSDTRGALRRLIATVERDVSAAAGSRGRPHERDATADRSTEDGDIVRGLQVLGADVPPGRRARESRLRERVAARLAGTASGGSSTAASGG